MKKPKKRKTYSRRFKQKAQRMFIEQGMTLAQIEKELKLPYRTLYKWNTTDYVNGTDKTWDQMVAKGDIKKDVSQTVVEFKTGKSIKAQSDKQTNKQSNTKSNAKNGHILEPLLKQEIDNIKTTQTAIKNKITLEFQKEMEKVNRDFKNEKIDLKEKNTREQRLLTEIQYKYTTNVEYRRYVQSLRDLVVSWDKINGKEGSIIEEDLSEIINNNLSDEAFKELLKEVQESLG